MLTMMAQYLRWQNKLPPSRTNRVLYYLYIEVMCVSIRLYRKIPCHTNRVGETICLCRVHHKTWGVYRFYTTQGKRFEIWLFD